MLLVLLAPSKTMAFDTRRGGVISTAPYFQSRATELAATIARLSPDRLGALLGISPKLAATAHAYYQSFHADPLPRNPDAHRDPESRPPGPRVTHGDTNGLTRELATTPAILAFQGDVYRGLDAADLSDDDLHWAHDHVAILSGLYGLLQPRDAIQPHRLEMAGKLAVDGHKNLYAYWGDAVTTRLNDLIAANRITAVIGCVSDEYLSVIRTGDLAAPFIQCVFRETKDGKPRIVPIHAKRARGLIARYVIEHRVTNAADLHQFTHGGYMFDPTASTATSYVFTR